ncbi:MAG: hydrogenase expression/formation protein HypE [Ferrimicrobium sp.]
MVRGITFTDPQILLAHGSGGKASRRLIEGLLVPVLSCAELDRLGDGAVVKVDCDEIVVTTDSFVVNPMVFPGGSIGELAVNGTLNDLAVSGAEPIALTLAMILEAGLDSEHLVREVQAVARAAKAAGVDVVTGDTKVVEHGKADGIFMTTTGVGRLHPKATLSPERAVDGDRVLLSGALGDHGITVLLERDDFGLASGALRSDTRAIWPFVRALLDAFGPEIKWMRDPTRGGLATTLNEFALSAGFQVVLEESAIIVHEPVRGACELLGLDPLHIANEGQFMAIVSETVANQAEELLRSMPGGAEARLIGTIYNIAPSIVRCNTGYGASRVLDMLIGDPLPRIC